MKAPQLASLCLCLAPAVIALAACGGNPPVGVTTPSGAAVPAPTEKTPEQAAAPLPAAPAAPAAPAPAPAPAKEKQSLDPLSVGSDLEAAAVPTIVQTPAKELRPQSRAGFESALKLMQGEGTPEAAAKKLTARLGKPTWIESGKKRVWIAKDGKSCHRFVLDADGQADLETASASEWRMLTALAKQNACTGEIKRGALGD